MPQTTFKPKLNVLLKNKITGEQLTVNVLDENEIDGKLFWVAQHNNRVVRLSKDAYTIQKSK
jgi:hypothetical protein